MVKMLGGLVTGNPATAEPPRKTGRSNKGHGPQDPEGPRGLEAHHVKPPGHRPKDAKTQAGEDGRLCQERVPVASRKLLKQRGNVGHD